MSVRVWRSHAPTDRSQLADWEMECSEHVDEGRITTTDWLWAMEAAWGHIAMHHPRDPIACTHEFGWHPATRPDEHKCLDCGVPLPTTDRDRPDQTAPATDRATDGPDGADR